MDRIRPTSDRSRPTPDAYNWAFLALTLALAGIHLYLGIVDGRRATQFVLIGLALFAGPVMYFTRLWRPVLYLLGATFVLYLGTLWALGGAERFVVGVGTGVLATAFVLLAIFLFLREEGLLESR